MYVQEILKINDESLREIMGVQCQEIANSIAGFTIEKDYEPKEVLKAIIEEIKLNREAIVKEGKISCEIIESSLKKFYEQLVEDHTNCELQDINISYGSSST